MDDWFFDCRDLIDENGDYLFAVNEPDEASTIDETEETDSWTKNTAAD